MEFSGAADHYDRFMGRYTVRLAAALADAAEVEMGQRAVDVGCGPGGLTSELADRLGPERVAAIDPAAQFVAACRERHPGADVREGVAEALPWEDDSFDVALSCLVIGFMGDPDRGLAEMARVTRPGGAVAVCMWDFEQGGMEMLRTFWTAVRSVNPDSTGERERPGTSEGDIAERMGRVGIADVSSGSLTSGADYASFDDFWAPFTYGVGPAGRRLTELPEDKQARVREACRALLPEGSFSLEARAWYGVGRTPDA